MDGSVIPIDRTRSAEAVEVLTRALLPYPTMRWIARSERPGFEDRLRAVYRVAVAMQRVEGQPVLGVSHAGPGADELAGVAVVHDPGRALTARSALVGLARSVFSPARSTLVRGHRYETAIERVRPREPHHFLSVIGVLPALQRSGYGRALMDAIHRRADADPLSTGVCLDTCDPANRAYYERFGYEVAAECRTGPLHQWILFRSAARRRVAAEPGPTGSISSSPG